MSKAINPVDLASIASIAKILNAAIYPDGESPAVEGVYIKVTGIELWSEVENRSLGSLVENEEGSFLEFLPPKEVAYVNPSLLYPPGTR